MPLVNAGWLYCHVNDTGEKEYYIAPCDFARVEYGIVQQFLRASDVKLDPNRRQSAARKYAAWGNQLTSEFEVPVRTLLTEGSVAARSKVTRISNFGEVKGGGAKRRGRLVFTGQPQDRRPGEKRKKHHEFFFYGEKSGPDIPVTKEQFDTFQRVHSDGAEQHAHEISPNEEWRFWRKVLNTRAPTDPSGAHGPKRVVPVFFVVHKDLKVREGSESDGPQPQLYSFGLAMMFRLAYDQSTINLRDRTQRVGSKPDMAELMFGYVNQDQRGSEGSEDHETSLRGRIAIGHARAVGDAPLGTRVKAVLSAPKPTYYPAYVTQGNQPGEDPRPQQRGRGYLWTAYMREQQPKLRGWKRYLTRNQWVTNPPLPDRASENVFTTFQPIREGATFRFKIRVHNLKRVELGALLWSLTFGDAPQARHLLGMARALGYGQVKLRVIDHYLIANDDLEQTPLDQGQLDSALSDFRGYMSFKTNRKWANSSTLKELIACATPHPSGRDPEHLRAPLLKHPSLRNEFAHYKQQGKALPLHSSDTAYRTVLSLLTEREQAEPKDVS